MLLPWPERAGRIRLKFVQHLAVLYRGGLVDRQRSGRRVLYQASELGLALLDRALLRSGR